MAVVVFVVIRVAPGNPIAMMLPPGATDADIDRLRALYGLDKSILAAILHLARGRAAAAISAPRSRCARTCWALVLNRLPATLELSIVALLIALA